MHPAHYLEYLVISYQRAGPANVPRETDTLCAVPRQVPQSPSPSSKEFMLSHHRTATAEHRTAHRLDESCLLFEHLTRTFLFPTPPMFHVKHCFSAPLAINVSRETFIVKWANSGKRSVPHSRMFHVKHKGRTRVDRNTGRRSNLVIRTYPQLPTQSFDARKPLISIFQRFIQKKAIFQPLPYPLPKSKALFRVSRETKALTGIESAPLIGSGIHAHDFYYDVSPLIRNRPVGFALIHPSIKTG